MSEITQLWDHSIAEPCSCVLIKVQGASLTVVKSVQPPPQGVHAEERALRGELDEQEDDVAAPGQEVCEGQAHHQLGEERLPGRHYKCVHLYARDRLKGGPGLRECCRQK